MIPPGLTLVLAKSVGVLIALGAIWTVGYVNGREAVQQQWDAAIAQQQMDAGENIVQNAQNTAIIESRYQRTIDAQTQRVRALTQEVHRYANQSTKPCEVSAEFVTVFDALSGMHNTSADGMPTAADPTGAAPVLSETAVTDAEVLEIHQLTVVELANLWDTYSALVDWVRSSHAIAQEGAGR